MDTESTPQGEVYYYALIFKTANASVVFLYSLNEISMSDGIRLASNL